MPAALMPAGPPRRARCGDHDQVLALFAQVNQARGGTYIPAVADGSTSLPGWFDRKQLDDAWVLDEPAAAGQPGRVIAHVGVRRSEAGLHWGLTAGAGAEVCRLAVDPQHQRTGLARQLMGHVQQVLGAEPARLTCHAGSTAERLYLNLGWQRTPLEIRWPDDPAAGALLTADLACRAATVETGARRRDRPARTGPPSAAASPSPAS